MGRAQQPANVARDRPRTGSTSSTSTGPRRVRDQTNVRLSLGPRSTLNGMGAAPPGPPRQAPVSPCAENSRGQPEGSAQCWECTSTTDLCVWPAQSILPSHQPPASTLLSHPGSAANDSEP